MMTLYQEENSSGRATLEMDPDGSHLFTVSGPGKGAPGMTIILDQEETALFRNWGGRFLEILARQMRAEPDRFASRNLLPPFDPAEGEREGEWDWRAERAEEERRKGSRKRLPALAAALAALALVIMVAYVLDRPSGGGKELHGTAVFIHAGPVEGEERAFLVVTLYGGEEVSVPVPASHVVRPGGRVVVREFRSRIFGKRTFRFERYL